MTGLGLFGALLLSAQPLGGLGGEATASPVSVPPLAAGEVLLEVNAVGRSSTRADRASVTVRVAGSGANEAAARRVQSDNLARVRAAAQAAQASRVEVQALGSVQAMIVQADADEGSAEAPASRVNDIEVMIELNDIARVASLVSALEAVDGASAERPVYMLSNEAVAGNAARREAVALARAEADSYAAALDMRVVRVVRLTERAGFDILGMMMGMIGGGGERDFERMADRSRPDIITLSSIGMDFALAPR